MDSHHSEEDFLSGANAIFIAEMHQRWQRNPDSVDQDWADFFKRLDGLDTGSTYSDKPDLGWGKPPSQVIGAEAEEIQGNVARSSGGKSSLHDEQDIRAATLDSIRAIMLIRAYRIRGHLMAKLDPLGLGQNIYHPELDPATYGFDESDMDRPIFINFVLGREVATLREILSIVRDTYCSTIGVEFMHIQDPEQKAWIQERIEGIRNQTTFTKRGKMAIYERLVSAENFEQYLHKKYVGTKRFGLDGGEAVIPALGTNHEARVSIGAGRSRGGHGAPWPSECFA